MKFKEYDFDYEDDFIQAMEEIQMRKELKVVDNEWFLVWMLQKVQRRRGMEYFQFQTLRYVLKIVYRMKEFVTNF